MMELEEGEACYYKDDDDTSIDPDIALSYIDEKLQSVLGHFQKDFEGGVSAENLGAKFGGYGSFLPTYQRSPTVISQPRTPQISQNQAIPRSPNRMPSEYGGCISVQGPPQNSKAVFDPPSTQRNCTPGSRVGHTLHNARNPCGDDAARQDSCFSGQVCNKLPVKHELPVSKSLKLRIRVGSDKTAQKTTALHTSLGLTSPSSSMENSPTESGEMSEFQKIPDDSPASILQTMTSFSVTGGLLSPLHEKLLTLSRNEKLFTEIKPLTVPKDTNPQSVLSADSSTSVLIGKKTKAVRKDEHIEELNSGVRNDSVSLIQKKMGLGSLDNRHCFSNDLNQRVVPVLVCDTRESVKGAGRAREGAEKEVPMKKREINRLKDELFGSDLDKDESFESLSDQSSEKYEHQEVRSSSMELQVKNASDSKERGRGKRGMSVPSFTADSDISQSERDSNGAICLRKKAVMKAASHEPDQPGMPQTEKKSSAGKKKLTERLPNLVPAEDPGAGVSDVLKNKKSSKKDASMAHLFDAQLEKTTSLLDSQGRLPGDKLKKSKLEVLEGQQSFSAKSRQGLGKKVDIHVASRTAMKDPLAAGILAAEELTTEAQPPVDHVFIEEDWVACDKCQKWRLLPYGVKTESLPERWMCSMLDWLPGMNRCEISEDETTEALHAFYQMPPPENQNSLQNHAVGSAPGLISADIRGLGSNSHQSVGVTYMANGGKKKHKSRETPNTCSNIGPVLASNMNMQQELVKSRSGKNVTQPVGESNVVSKSKARIPVKSSDVLDKNLNKPKERMAIGDEKTKKKSKRESGQYDHRDLKKLKTNTDQGFPATRKVVTDIQDYRQRGNLKEGKSESTEKLQILENKRGNPVHHSQDGGYGDLKIHSGKEISVKKRKLSDQDYLTTSQSNGNHLADSDDNALEVSGESEIRKQKKSKVLQTEKKDSSSSKGDDKSRMRGATVTRIILPGNHLGGSDGNALEVSGESEIRKQKKSKVLQTEKKDFSSSKGEDKSRMRGATVTRIVLPGTRDSLVDRNGEREYQAKKYRVKVPSRLTMEDIDSLKKDLGAEPLSMAATSSSSKVSDSRKSRANHQVKGSPVESVSSSPMRMIITSKASPERMESSVKDDTKMGEYLDRDGDFQSGRSRMRKKSGDTHSEAYGNSALEFRGSSAKENSESCVKSKSDSGNSHLGVTIADVLEERSPFTTGNGKGRANKKHVPVLNEHKSAKQSPLQFKQKDRRNTGFNTQWVEENISDQPVTQEVLNSKKCSYEETKVGHNYLESGTKSSKNSQNISKKDPTHCNDNKREHRVKHCDVGSNTKLNCASDTEGKVLLKQKPDHELDARIATNGGSSKTESRELRSQINAHAEDKQVRLAVSSKLASGFQKGSLQAANTSLTTKDPGTAVCQNVNQNSMGNLELDLSKRETSSQTASIVLREAESLRDRADSLKNSGFHAEYNQAYFQAALKFLQGASLLESTHGETSKNGEMNQIQIYSNTAKLCETCAHEYAKHDEFATAALAYKCMEVAYMRVVYCKNMSSNRVWHDLQASLQIPPQGLTFVSGESPSSSASDVDNTNNQPMAEKTALSRGNGLHAVNHVIAPRNRPNFVRLLDFTKDVNFAMEASRKAQDAFTAANAQAESKDAIMSVKRVIDFSFQDVEELIRLARQAFEAISHNSFGGNRG